jgi:hypothetical protein
VSNGAFAAGQIVGVGLMVVLPVAVGIWWAGRLNAKREGYDPVRWPVGVGAVLSLFVLLGQCAAPRAAVSDHVTGGSNG